MSSLPPPTVSRLNTVLQAAGMFQKCFLLFFLGGLHRDTGDTDWWHGYLQMFTCMIIPFKSVTMHGFISKRQYVALECWRWNLILHELYWWSVNGRHCSVCVLLLESWQSTDSVFWQMVYDRTTMGGTRGHSTVSLKRTSTKMLPPS